MLFLVCFDLGANQQEQLKQVSYWLDYLQSLLCPELISETIRKEFLSKWRVILVGLRLDLLKSSSEIITASIQQWKHLWSNLPLYNSIILTSKEDSTSVYQLWEIIQAECEAIMNKFTKQVPTAYLVILDHLRSAGRVHSTSLIRTNDFRLQSAALQLKVPSALRYLHAVGDIILLPDGMICTQPASVAQMMAKFVSPESVQQSLPHIAAGKLVVLTTEHVGRILMMNESDPKLLAELQIMSSFGICYQLPIEKNSKPSFMFPSLAQESPRMLILLNC